MKRTPTTAALLSLTLMLGFTACQDESDDLSQSAEPGAEVSVTIVQAEGESEMESVFELVEDEMAIISESLEGGSVSQREHRILAACATVTHHEENRQVTIDFGEENCLGKDGLYRRGTIVISYDGYRHEPGASRTISLQDYYVNDNLLTGTKTITNATEPEGVPAFHITLTEATYTNARGSVSWSSNRQLQVVEGADTPRNPFDNKVQVTGNTSGTNRRGVTFSYTVKEPLIRNTEAGCARTFVDGIIAYENENGLSWTLDYDPVGGQPCDRLGAVTIGEKTYPLTLR
ncbi:hypothetical protein AB9P05_23195 [Roseivirga sp. BDSF3-8]|uniref:hypothetical protein n=1 Tax=Roseivirga sp. BDSF3-8 TaxID=3241598 RepID=UPI0035325BF2